MVKEKLENVDVKYFFSINIAVVNWRDCQRVASVAKMLHATPDFVKANVIRLDH